MSQKKKDPTTSGMSKSQFSSGQKRRSCCETRSRTKAIFRCREENSILPETEDAGNGQRD